MKEFGRGKKPEVEDFVLRTTKSGRVIMDLLMCNSSKCFINSLSNKAANAFVVSFYGV